MLYFQFSDASLVPFWDQKWSRKRSQKQPERAWVYFWEPSWRRETDQVIISCWDHSFFTVLELQDDFRGVLGPSKIDRFGINRVLEPQKVSPITSSGREPRFSWKSDRFWGASIEQNHWFYIGFIIVSAISAYRSIDSKITSFGANKTRIFEVFGDQRRSRIDLFCDFWGFEVGTFFFGVAFVAPKNSFWCTKDR